MGTFDLKLSHSTVFLNFFALITRKAFLSLLVILWNNTRKDSTHGHHQIVNTEIRLIIFFAAKDGEALYSQQKQDRELTVAQIMKYLLQNSDLN